MTNAKPCVNAHLTMVFTEATTVIAVTILHVVQSSRSDFALVMRVEVCKPTRILKMKQ